MASDTFSNTLHTSREIAIVTVISRDWLPDEAPTADSVSGDHSYWPNQQHRGIGSANVKRALWLQVPYTCNRRIMLEETADCAFMDAHQGAVK